MSDLFPDWISYDALNEVITIHGVRYSVGLFWELGLGPLDRPLKIIKREDGVITIQVIDQT